VIPRGASKPTARIGSPPGAAIGPDELLRQVARGDEQAFRVLYEQLAPRVYGLAKRVRARPGPGRGGRPGGAGRGLAYAARFDFAKGSATSWVLTITHRRAVDRVRAAQSGPTASAGSPPPASRPRTTTWSRSHREPGAAAGPRCLQGLTDLQREAITLAYYDGFTYREVAEKLDTALPTIKSRMRDGLIRMRDCLGVEVGFATGGR
jgi:RNA polymerase sigma-70 factor (ECF subfamily)